MKVGIVGFSGVGKTTLFSALSGQLIAHRVPGERHRASVVVRDSRLEHLQAVYQPRKFTPARCELEDLPALPEGDLKGKGELLDALREPEALILLCGHFESARLSLSAANTDPRAQAQNLLDELLLLDLELVEKRLARIDQRFAKGGGDRTALQRERTFVEKVQAALESDPGTLPPPEDPTEERIFAEMKLFAVKPKVMVFNVEEGFDRKGDESRALCSGFEHAAVLCGPVEEEIARIEGEDRTAFLVEYGLEEPASERVTTLAYSALDLISFFTVGPDEVRAWPITRGSDAVTSAGKIHTDLARGFIRAEVISYESVQSARDPKQFKELAKQELKGKDYVVQDGDILNIRFSV